MKRFSFLLSLVFNSLYLFLFNLNFVSAGPLDLLKVNPNDDVMALLPWSGFDPNATVGDIMAQVIVSFLSLLGVVFIILIMLGGFKWMTSGGNEGKVLMAKQTIKRAVIGFVIIMSAYVITAFVFTAVQG